MAVMPSDQTSVFAVLALLVLGLRPSDDNKGSA
jgi:hypothetical protein